MSGDNLYPAPTLQVFPGETLIVHFENALSGLTIRDFFDPRYIAKGEEVPLYPEQLTIFAAQPAHSRRAYQPEGKFRQCDAAHPGGDVEHLHLPHSQKHAAGRLLVSQPSAWTDDTPRVLRVGRACSPSAAPTAIFRWSPSTTFPSGTWCCSTMRSSIGQEVSRSSTIPIGRNGSARRSRRKPTSWRRARTGRCSRR